MEASKVSLQRLISEKDVEALAASFAGLLVNPQIVLFNAGGELVARHGNDILPEGWAERVGAALLSAAEDDPICLEHITGYPLLVDKQRMGWLVVDAPGPVGAAMQAVLVMLLQERVEKRRLASETLDRYREVNLLYHLAERLGSLDVGEIMQRVLAEAERLIRADCGIVWLTGPGLQMEPQAVTFGNAAQVEMMQTLLHEMLAQNPQPPTSDIITGAANLLYAPLWLHDDFLGILALWKAPGQAEFIAGQGKLLLALAGQAAGAIEKAVLHQQELQHQKIAQELEIGRRIQRSLLPKSMPEIPGWEVAVSYQTAAQVGGDFYDVFSLTRDAGCEDASIYGLTIADVTGKGIPAAFMMAYTQGVLRAAAFAHPGPGEALYHTNQSILKSSHSGLLLTAFYAVLNPCTGELTYANGGHEPPILCQAGSPTCQELKCGSSLLLGARWEQPYHAFSTRLEPGDLLLLYTDGITEARNTAGEFFAEERLYAVLAAHAREGCTAVIRAVNEALKTFTEGKEQSDDITLLALRRLA